MNNSSIRYIRGIENNTSEGIIAGNLLLVVEDKIVGATNFNIFKKNLSIHLSYDIHQDSGKSFTEYEKNRPEVSFKDIGWFQYEEINSGLVKLFCMKAKSIRDTLGFISESILDGIYSHNECDYNCTDDELADANSISMGSKF